VILPQYCGDFGRHGDKIAIFSQRGTQKLHMVLSGRFAVILAGYAAASAPLTSKKSAAQLHRDQLHGYG
jgi:hypothetical protein